MAHLRTRAAALTAATLLVAGALLAVFSARFTLVRDTAPDMAAVQSEIVRPPMSASRPSPAREMPPPVEPTPNEPPPPPAPEAQALDDGEAPLVTNPIWIARPPNPERFYPRAAFMRGVEGRVELDCLVELDGQLTCVVASEAPTGQGFGDAALALARAHVMQPATRHGVPVRARYRMIVPFSVR